MKYPVELKDNWEIARYIEECSTSFVDEERIAENYIGCQAILQEIDIDDIRLGPEEANEVNKNKQNKYNKMDVSEAPPIVVDNGEVIDGNHRLRAAKKQKVKTILAYIIIEK